jgi:hypothetical protein
LELVVRTNERRKEGKKEGRKEGKKERRKEGKKERRKERTLLLCFLSLLYLCFSVSFALFSLVGILFSP